MAVWNVGMYSKSMTESSKSVLIEVLRILGSYKDYLVLTGGWAPYFILEKFGERGQHCGSVDIDFVLNPRLIDLKVYETIVSSIEKRGYKPYVADDGEVLPYRFYRTVKAPLDDAEYKIEVDFISEPDVVKRLSPEKFLAVQKDLQAVVIRGSSVVFSHSFEHEIEGVLPNGAETRVSTRISDAVGILATKGLALKGRYKEKDPYDIYFVLKHHRGGPKKVAEKMRGFVNESIVAEALEEIREKFRTVRSEGPFQVAYFLAPEDERLQERIQGEAYAVLRTFLDGLEK